MFVDNVSTFGPFFSSDTFWTFPAFVQIFIYIRFGLVVWVYTISCSSLRRAEKATLKL